MKKLKSKVALVTGGASGFIKAIAQHGGAPMIIADIQADCLSPKATAAHEV